jgi:hypothetical protein
MRVFILPLFLMVLMASCNGSLSSGKGSANGTSGSSSADGSGGPDKGSGDKTANTNPDGSSSRSTDPLIDSAKLKSEINDLMNSLASGKPDTAKLKKTMSDVLNTTATVLSDSGISTLGGNSNDPSQNSAKEALKKMRDGLGITPDKLDSIRKAAAQIQKN